MTDLLHGLNDAQREAVLATDGPSLIIAGAGSGKTRVLTVRMAYLISKGVDSFRILALTFTNKAAREMRVRIEKEVGAEARNIWMGTFHSVFAKILRIEADKIGYPRNFTIYDTDDSRSAIRAIVKELQLDDKIYKANGVHSRISAAKNRLISVKEYQARPEYQEADAMARIPEMGRIYQMYQERLFKSGAMDFDDLLFNTNVLFRDHLDVLNKYQQKFHYLLVDEYQDTNMAQYLIVRKLASVRRNIAVVGDDAQSIYSFRGADIQNILNFGKDYPDLKLFRLEQNYRSTKAIVAVANSAIKQNRNQIEKTVWTANEEGELVELLKATSDNEEARLVATQIFEQKMAKALNYKDFAILYRTNAQSRTLEESLRRNSIRYRIFGGLSFYQRKEIKDLVSYLRFIVNPVDEEAFKRIVNFPRRGIGEATVARVAVQAATAPGGLTEVIRYPKAHGIDGRAANLLENFAILLDSFRIAAEGKDAYEVANQVAKESGILRELYEDKTIEGLSRYENVQELLNAVKSYVDAPDTEDLSLAGFLQVVSLATDSDDEAKNNDDAVTLMTVHSAKGLEFKHVFIVGIEEDLFPSQMALQDRDGLEEERRLFYVACTRAEHSLTLSYATSRYRYGQLKPCEPSRFLEELDQRFLKVERRYEQPEEHPLRFFDQFKERRGEKVVPVGIKRPGVLAGAAPATTRQAPFKEHKPSAGFAPSDLAALAPGMNVEHQKFGHGKVISIDDQGANRKALVAFETQGEKTLVLSFAKLMIHGG